MATTFDVLGAKKAGYSEKEIADYLASQADFDIQGAYSAGYSPKEVIQHLNKTGAGAFETFLTSAKQEAGSEIKGAYQALGGELDTASESQRRQMESENPISGALGTLAGGLLNPSTIPAVRGLKMAVATGAAGGFLQPRYEEEDLSRGTSAAIGAGIGAGVFGIAAILTKFGSKIGSRLVKEAEQAGAKTEKEIVEAVEKRTGQKVTETTNVNEAVTIPDVEATPKLEAPDINLPPESKVVNQEVDSIQPILDGIGDPAEKEAIVLSIANGDYTRLFRASPFQGKDVPLDRITYAFAPENPNRIDNMDAFIKSRLSGRQETEDLMSQVYSALKTNVTSRLGKLNRVDIPEDVAASGLLSMKIQEVASADLVEAFIPAVKKAKDDLFAINELMNTLEGSGMTRREAAAMLAPDFQKAESILTAALGNASNTGLALQALKKQAAVLGSTKNILRNVLDKDAPAVDRLLSLSDSFKAIDGSLDYNLDKTIAKTELVKTALTTPSWKDKAGEYVVNAYISGLATPAVNVMSAGFKVPMAVATRFVQGLIPGSGVSVRESGAMLRGIFQGINEGASFAREGFKTGTPIDSTTEFKKSIEGKLGEVVRTPTKVGVSADEWAKAVFRRMEWNALATRVGYSGKFAGREEEVVNLLRGINLGDASKKIFQQEVKNAEGKVVKKEISIPEWANKILEKGQSLNMTKDEAFGLAQQVHYFAKQQTFQEEFAKGTMLSNLMKFRAQHPELAFIIPFVKTPLNIMKDALSYMGATAIPGMYKTMSKDEKIARLAVGSTMVAMLGSKVYDGTLTGSYSKDPGKRAAAIAAGIPEYSIKIGDTWYSYARIEPIATVLGTTVDGIKTTAEYFAKNPKDRKVGEFATDVVSGFTKNIASKTFLEGISTLMQAIHDPQRYGGSFINGFAGLVVPSFVAAPARALDPNMRVVTNFEEAVRNRLPGLREELPAQSKLYGGLRPNPYYGFSAFTGIQTQPAEQTNVQQILTKAGVDYAMPGKKIKGVELTGEQQARYQELSAGMMDRVLRSVNSEMFQALPPARQKAVIEQRMKQARAYATKRMEAEMIRDPEFRKEVIRMKRMKKGYDTNEE